MKIIKLLKCEFIKNFSWKKFIIILITLMLSCLILIKYESFFGGIRVYNLETLSIDDFNKGYEKAKIEYQNNPNLVNEGILEIFNRIKPSYENAYNLIGNTDKILWQSKAINVLELEIPKLIVLKQLKNNYDSPILKELVENSKDDPYYTTDKYIYYKAEYISYINRFINSSYHDNILFLENQVKSISYIEDSLKENKYYLYEQGNYMNQSYIHKLNNQELPVSYKEIVEYVINNKIEDENDYRIKNIQQYYEYLTFQVKIPTIDDYNSDKCIKYGNYELTKRYYSKLKDITNKNQKIITFAYKNKLKHDVYNPYENIDTHYFTSKQFMNQGLHLGIIIVILMIIIHSGIMANEHNKGTIKLLLTTPIKRSKILFSKILYLILETYILWIIGSIIMFLLVGFNYGFSDLLTNKLIVSGSNVIEFNYILWYLKEMIICMIPISCLLIVLFSFSTISLNTSLTASILSIISIISVTIWILISNFGMSFLSFLSYTPIPYLDFWFVRYNSKYYLQAISNTMLSNNYGILISIVVSIILYFITNIIYLKRDIKN